jgi:energy-coupling factor transporter ATP-binding protein EcfA2
MSVASWPYPGSRWWKFDFHTHTPASLDTRPWQEAKGTANEITPEKWLLQYMATGIDCVAVTDHNTGSWIDDLKRAYAGLEQARSADFRPLTIFPGVEISTNGGVHILAIFDTSAATADIDSLLGAVGYRGTKGDSDAETSESIEHVLAKVLEAGAIAIPAHADTAKGLLRCQSGTQRSEVSAHAIEQALSVEGLLAIEWTDNGAPFPECAKQHAHSLAQVLGSDCHNFRGGHTPGSRYSWVKMAEPTLEGLRLALLDGNDISLKRVEDGVTDRFKPFDVPKHVIRAIEVSDARVMGRGNLARVACSPFFNAIVGGRGTGKSTLVHTLRLALGRDDELEDGEPRRQFDAFCNVCRGRDDDGALLANTEIRVEWRNDRDDFRLCWQAGQRAISVEQLRGGAWVPSQSQAVNSDRFPVRILSQGQIASMASGARGGLLAIVDEAGEVEALKEEFAEAGRTFFAQRARLRELDGRLAALPELERKLSETTRKLETLAQSDHAQVLRDYATTQRQLRAVKSTFEQLRTNATKVAALSNDLPLDDWPPNSFDAIQDAEALAWRREMDAKMDKVRSQLRGAATEFSSLIETESKDSRLLAVWERSKAATAAHGLLQKQLAEQGVEDPQAFARLTQERQRLETQHKSLVQLEQDRANLIQQIKAQQAILKQRREDITAARAAFIQQAISNNPHVRMVVIPMGFDAEVIERELRAVLDAPDHFEADILSAVNGEPEGGLASELAKADPATKVGVLEGVKSRLLNPDDRAGGHFRNFLIKAAQKPEFADRILAWFPEDDLRIEYQRQGTWHSIREGSQGQRSAALLAFLLAFGEEPIVLDQPEDDLDNHLIYELIVQQIRQNKLRRQLIVVTHNANVVVNGDADLVHAMGFGGGQCFVTQSGALQEKAVREEVCRVMEGGHEAFKRRWKRLGKEI